MGIKHMNKFINQFFSNYISDIKIENNFSVDNLLIDMNCIIHYSAQKTYRYGLFKDVPIGFGYPKTIDELNLVLFKDVTNILTDIINRTRPKKRIFFGIDGPAPLAKQNQQRQRRFRAVQEAESLIDYPQLNIQNFISETLPVFNTNQISPGTEFLYSFSKFLENWVKKDLITKKIKTPIEIFISNERVPGEGEYKCMDFIRKRIENRFNESFCINGPDADLYMLTLGTLIPNFFIIKENLFKKGILDPRRMIYSLYDMKNIREELLKMLRKNDNISLIEDNLLIYDFIIFCFFAGNDFVPSLPTIDIIENGIEQMIQINKTLSSHFLDDKNKIININTLYEFCQKLGFLEKETLLKKYADVSQFLEIDEIFKKVLNQKKEFELEDYKMQYLEKKIKDKENNVSTNYIDGLNWILRYYFYGIVDWNYVYFYSYAPFASMITQNIDITKLNYYNLVKVEPTTPTPPFLQLLAILPSKNKNLIPSPLNEIMELDNMKKYYPDIIEIDFQGKRKEFEGIVILPFINMQDLIVEYNKKIQLVSEEDLKRNNFAKIIFLKSGN